MPDSATASDDAPLHGGGDPVPDGRDPVPGDKEPTAGGGEPTTASDGAPMPAGGPGQGPSVPDYKGEPLDAERGPGLGCFWIQIALLTFFLVLTPLTVTWGWDSRISGVLLILTLVLLLFSGQTIIFLLRLVAADRRTRRTPLSPAAKPTVGQMEDAATATAPTATGANEEGDDPATTRTRDGTDV